MQISATDAAGNQTVLSGTVSIDGTPPAVDLRPPRRRKIILRVNDPASGFAAGQILVRQTSAEAYRPLQTTLSGRTLRAQLDRGRPARTDVRVVARDVAGNEVNGVPARFALSSARSGRAQLKLRGGRVRAKFGRPLKLRGRLTLSAGQP